MSNFWKIYFKMFAIWGTFFIIISFGFFAVEVIASGCIFLAIGVMLPFVIAFIQEYSRSKEENQIRNAIMKREATNLLKIMSDVLNDISARFNLKLPQEIFNAIVYDAANHLTIQTVSADGRKCDVKNENDLYEFVYAILVYHVTGLKRYLPEWEKDIFPSGEKVDRFKVKTKCFYFIKNYLLQNSIQSLSYEDPKIKEELISIIKNSVIAGKNGEKSILNSYDSANNVFSESFSAEINSCIEQIIRKIESNIKNAENLDAESVAFAEVVDSEFGVIKKSPLARLDFSIYIFFNLYCSLCGPNNEKFVRKFEDSYETFLKNYFRSEINDSTLVNKIFDQRLIAYDKIMRTAEDADGALINKINDFLIQDIWFNSPLSEAVPIIGDTDKMLLHVEVATLYRKTFEDIGPLVKSLADLSNQLK